MATPTIEINQTPLVAGGPGVSREDLVLGVPVVGTAPANGAGSYSWELGVPPGSSATLSNGNTATCSFTPDVRGTYLLYLVFDGEASYTLDADLNKISTQGGAAVKMRQGVRPLGVGETFQFDGVSGWAEDFAPYFETIDAVTAAKGAAVGSLFYADANGDLVALAAGTSTYLLQANGAGAPTWVVPPSGISDHGALSGLGDNDHPQYRLVADAISLQDAYDDGASILTTGTSPVSITRASGGDLLAVGNATAPVSDKNALAVYHDYGELANGFVYAGINSKHTGSKTTAGDFGDDRIGILIRGV